MQLGNFHCIGLYRSHTHLRPAFLGSLSSGTFGKGFRADIEFPFSTIGSGHRFKIHDESSLRLTVTPRFAAPSIPQLCCAAFAPRLGCTGLVPQLGCTGLLLPVQHSGALTFSCRRSMIAARLASRFSLICSIFRISFSSAILLKLLFSSKAFWRTSRSCSLFSANCFSTWAS